jgi:hypothetical protein
MKKFLLAVVCLLGMQSTALACDICGCASGASYMGTMPQIQRSFVGMRYNWRSYTVTPAHSNEGGLISENYHSADVWARYFPHKRVQVLAFVPYTYYSRQSDMQNIRTQGLGDISLMAGYMVYNTGDSIGKRWKHTFSVNAGVKLPTGQFNIRHNGLRLTPNMQPGTGSVDYLANLFYTIRYNKVGITTDANARFCSTNSNSYKVGNRYNASARFFVWQKLDFNSSILPSVGLSYDYATKDTDFRKDVAESGGSGTFATIGVEYYYRRFAVGANCQLPLAYNYADNLSKPNPRASAQIMFVF